MLTICMHLANIAWYSQTVVPLVVLRPIAEAESAILQLRLIPKTGWGGRGLLG